MQLLQPQPLFAVTKPLLLLLPQPQNRSKRIIQRHPQSLPLPPIKPPLLQPQPQPSLLPPQNNKRRIMIQQLLPPQLEKHPIMEPSEMLFTILMYVAEVVWFTLYSRNFSMVMSFCKDKSKNRLPICTKGFVKSILLSMMMVPIWPFVNKTSCWI